jgi:hypothetical protein
LAISHLSQFREEGQETHPVPGVLLRVKSELQTQFGPEGIFKINPGLQAAHVFAISHLSQFREEGQAAHPVPGVLLSVKPELQIAHVLAISHLSQFREEGQETHPVPEVLLKVKPGLHIAQ